MLRHGKPGHSASALSPRRTAASLITCSLRSTAAIVFGSSRNASKFMSFVNCSIAATASRMSAREREGSLKGKHGLALGLVAHRLFQCLSRRQIDTNSKQFREAVLDSNHVDKGEPTSGLELSNNIHVR